MLKSVMTLGWVRKQNDDDDEGSLKFVEEFPKPTA